MSIIIKQGSHKAKNRVLIEQIRKFNVPFSIEEVSDNEEPVISIYGKDYPFELCSMADSDIRKILGYSMVSVKQAKDIVNSSAILNDINEIPIDEVPVDSVIMVNIVSKVNNPLYPTSMRDGYGWNTKWNKNDKFVVRDESIFAENGDLLVELGDNETVYITTGGRVPPHFDSIIMIENVNVYRA